MAGAGFQSWGNRNEPPLAKRFSTTGTLDATFSLLDEIFHVFTYGEPSSHSPRPIDCATNSAPLAWNQVVFRRPSGCQILGRPRARMH
jgi:hypothetical protein